MRHPDFRRRHGSIRDQLINWSLVMSLVPLIVLAAVGYCLASSSLKDMAVDRLRQTSAEHAKFIRNWSDYRYMDVVRLSRSPVTLSLMQRLLQVRQGSDMSAAEFVASEQWYKVTAPEQGFFENHWLSYDYIYDLFLIDAQGDILFSLAKEADLGTNLMSGSYRESKFAGSVRRTLQSGEAAFSDFERYGPSGDLLSAFLTSPVTSAEGVVIGVLAIQIRLDRIQKSLMSGREHAERAASHYLVGADGLMRTALHSESEVLVKKVDSQLYKSWRSGYSESELAPETSDEEKAGPILLGYKGPWGERVIGVGSEISVGDIRWLLVSEVNQAEALAPAARLAEVLGVLAAAGAMVVILFTVNLSRKMTEPLMKLARISDSAAAGDWDQSFDIGASNEIGSLADNFRRMLEARRQHEQDLDENRKRLEMVVDAASVGVWDWNIQDCSFEVDRRWAEMIGYSLEELQPMSLDVWNQKAHPSDLKRSDALLERYLKGDLDAYECEVRLRHKQGHWVWTLDSGKVVEFDASGKPSRMIGIHLDITARKKAELDLIQAKDSAVAGAKAKTEFLASMSHEIRTPMNGVLGMLGLLSRGELNPTQQHQLGLAETSARSLLNIINDILDVSKIEAGKLDIEHIEFDLLRMLTDFSELEATRAQQKGLEFVLDFTGIRQAMVTGDPGRIRQILSNLVGNAIKFTDQGEVLLRARLEQGEQSLRLVCSVEDTGIGIPEQKMKSIFGAFNQLDSSTTRRYGGTGLGLAIVSQLCELMGGEISVASEEGVGSSFRFHLNLGSATEEKPVLPNIDLQNVSVLIVDDNHHSRQVLRSQLELWGASVSDADSGQQALQLLHGSDRDAGAGFRIALIDMAMPDMDGFALAQQIQGDKRFENLSMVMMDTIADRDDLSRLRKAGFQAYFPKPATFASLSRVLKIVLGDAQGDWEAVPVLRRERLVVGETLSSAAEFSDRWPKGIRVLIVEDNPVNQAVVRGIFDDLGLPSVIAESGVEALRILNGEQQENWGDGSALDETYYGMIFMDCQMPKMDGYETTRAIRDGAAGESYRQIPIVAMTANAMKGDRDKCLACGMDDYLSKPVDQLVIEERVNHWLLDRGAPLSDGHAAPVSASNSSSDLAEKDQKIEEVEPLWNRDTALKRMKGREDRLQVLVDMFLQNTPVLAEELALAVDSGQVENLVAKAHAIKGVAANLSAERLRQSALALEQAGKSDDLQAVPQLHSDFARVFAQTMTAFKSGS